MCGGIDDGFSDGTTEPFFGFDLADEPDKTIYSIKINGRVYLTEEPFTHDEIEAIKNTPEDVLIALFKEMGLTEIKYKR